MEGTVSSYSTTSMVVSLTNSGGSGTFASWYVSLTGLQGTAGANGTNGTNGTNGATGATGPTGAAGTNGTNGTNGSNGATGATGPTGAAGTNGTNGATGASGAGYYATSTTSLTIASSGSITITTQSGLAYVAGARVRFIYQTNSADYMEGTVTSYSGTSMVVSLTNSGGSGTFATWYISLTGLQYSRN
jgi:Collagen triple helix repeat (20 copies)